jgi:hypothetical protein
MNDFLIDCFFKECCGLQTFVDLASAMHFLASAMRHSAEQCSRAMRHNAKQIGQKFVCLPSAMGHSAGHIQRYAIWR